MGLEDRVRVGVGLADVDIAAARAEAAPSRAADGVIGVHGCGAWAVADGDTAAWIKLTCPSGRAFP